MRQIRCLWLIALVGASGCAAPTVPTGPLADAEPNQTPRIGLAGDRVVSLAVPIDIRSLPGRARTSIDAIAPEGRLVFCASERGPRGAGFRVERAYEKPFEHVRSILATAAGEVLERSHTVPLTKVPQHVLAAALTPSSLVESAEIVSGPEREEFWRIVTKDRRGRVFVVRVGLDGTHLSVMRRNQSRVDS